MSLPTPPAIHSVFKMTNSRLDLFISELLSNIHWIDESGGLNYIFMKVENEVEMQVCVNPQPGKINLHSHEIIFECNDGKVKFVLHDKTYLIVEFSLDRTMDNHVMILQKMNSSGERISNPIRVTGKNYKD